MSFMQLLIISRPRFWIYLIGPYLVGLAAASFQTDWVLLALGLYLTLPANLLIYGVNDIYDQNTDRLNPKKAGYENLLKPSQVRKLALSIASINLPFLPLLWLLPQAAVAWLLLFLITGIGYSAPPLRAKSRPFIDSLFNMLYVLPGLAAYTAASGQVAPVLVMLAALFWCMAMHAYSAVPDIQADTAASTHTVATFLGGPKTLVFCLVLYVVAAFISLPYLGILSPILGAVYIGLMVLSLVKAKHGSKNSLFEVYKKFPYINAAAGAGLFFWVWLVA